MHRTEAANASAGLYVDRNLPSTPGTLLEASDRNAVQNEIVNVIERAGLALKTKATETGDQLEAVIFDTVLNRTAEVNVSGSGLSTRLLNDRVSATKSSGTVYSDLYPEGIKHTPVLGSDEVGIIRTDCFVATSLSWTVNATVSCIYHTNDNIVFAGIPWSAAQKILHVSFRYKRSGDAYHVTCPMQAAFKESSSSTLELAEGTIIAESDPDPGATQELIITWETA